MGSFIIQMENRREEVDTGTGKMQGNTLGMTLYPSSPLWIVSGFLTCLILCPEILFHEKPEVNWSIFQINLCGRKLVSSPHLQEILLIATRSFVLPAGTLHNRMALGKLRSHLQSSPLQRLKSPFWWAGRRFCTDVTNRVTQQTMSVWEKIKELESSIATLKGFASSLHSVPHLPWISPLASAEVRLS